MKKEPTNRIAMILIAFLAFAPVLTGCSLRQVVWSVQNTGLFQAQPEQYETTFYDLFDTVTTIKGYADSQEEFTNVATEMYSELEDYHQLFDIYNTYEGIDNLKTINDNAGKAPVEVDERLIGLLLFGKEIYRESGGKVNIFMGSTLSLWHEAREAAERNPNGAGLPEDALLQEAAAHTDPDRVIISAEAKTVYLEDPAQRIDAGAIGKGYAAEQVMKAMRRENLAHEIAEHDDAAKQTASEDQPDDATQKETKTQKGDSAYKGYVLNLGGNICVSDPKPDGSEWSIGVQDPDSDGYLKKLGISQGSVVTSGDYQRYFMVDGKRYHHIIDPDTLQPADKWRSVTIIATDSATADFLSTALFLMDRAEGTVLLQKYNAEACWIDAEGTITESDGFKRYEK